jgi:hypothetical protein
LYGLQKQLQQPPTAKQHLSSGTHLASRHAANRAANAADGSKVGNSGTLPAVMLMIFLYCYFGDDFPLFSFVVVTSPKNLHPVAVCF